MEQKLNYLLDRSQPFTQERVKLLDQLTEQMYKGGSNVSTLLMYRQLKHTKFGSD